MRRIVIVGVVLSVVCGLSACHSGGSASSVFSSAGQGQAALPASYTLSLFAGDNKTDYGNLPASGPATRVALGVSGVAVDAAGNLYIADEGDSAIEKVTPSGQLSVIAGTAQSGTPVPGPATQSPLYSPSGVAVDASGNVYIADNGNNLVEKVSPSGQLSVIAGNGQAGEPVPGPATDSPMNPVGIAVDNTGTVYIADPTAHVIDKVTPDGQLSVVSTGGVSISPHGVAVDAAGNLYIANDFNVARITPGGTYSVIAGNGKPGGEPIEGPATSSPVTPDAVAVDKSGDIFITDDTNGKVERISSNGYLSVIAGTAQSPLPAFSGIAVDGIAVDASGNIYLTYPLEVLKLAP